MRSLLITAFLTLLISTALAKRAAPSNIRPVVVNGVEYRAPLGVEKIGFVQAWDVAKNKLLWEKKVYSSPHNPLLEQDVQWVFITELQLKNGLIFVTNERGERFSLDTESKKVEKLKTEKKKG